MQLMRVVGQGSVNTFLKYRATMLLKQSNMLAQLVPVFGLVKVRAPRSCCAAARLSLLYALVCPLDQAAVGEADSLWEGFIESAREGPFVVTEGAVISLKRRFQCFKFEEGSKIIKTESHVQFVLLVLQGSVAVNTPTKTTYTKGEFVCEYSFFQVRTARPARACDPATRQLNALCRGCCAGRAVLAREACGHGSHGWHGCGDAF